MKEILKDGVMPIGAYCSPQPATSKDGGYKSRITAEQYRRMADCGVNIVYFHNEIFGTETENDAFKALDCAAGAGIQCFVRDALAGEYVALPDEKSGARGYTNLTESEKAELDERFEKSLRRYCRHSAFGGISFWDEPGYDSFDGIAAAKKVFERVCPNKIFYVNHFPYYITPEQYQFGYWSNRKKGECTIGQFLVEEGKRNIDRYDYLYKGFIDKVKPEMFSYDAYPFLTLGSAKTGVHEVLWELPQYLHGMEEKTGIPFWAFLQAGGQWEGNTAVRLPTEGECRLGVSVPLLYGAKGLQIFPYAYPNDWLEDHTAEAGMVDRYGEKTRWYGWYKSIFKHVKAMESRLMRAKLKAVVKIGRYENSLPPKEELDKILWSECIFRGELPACESIEKYLPQGVLRGAEADTQCLIGCMEKENRELFFAVNDSSVVQASLKLVFGEKAVFTVIRNGETKEERIDGWSGILLPGECVLLEKNEKGN